MGGPENVPAQTAGPWAIAVSIRVWGPENIPAWTAGPWDLAVSIRGGGGGESRERPGPDSWTLGYSSKYQGVGGPENVPAQTAGPWAIAVSIRGSGDKRMSLPRQLDLDSWTLGYSGKYTEPNL